MSDVAMLLLADARTPTGGYAHSGGLEPAIAAGLDDVPGFLRARQATVARVEAVAAVMAAGAGDVAALLELEEELAARTPSAAARAASRTLGLALLRTARRLWPADALLAAYAEAAVTAARPIALGAAARAAGLDRLQVARLSLYEDAATVAGAAPKLLAVDAADTAAWLADLAPPIETAARDAVARAVLGTLPASGTPLLDCAPSATTVTRGGSLPARPLRLGIAGPVGTGKSTLVAALCEALAGDVRLGVVTNDIYTDEDARFLKSRGVLPDARILAVQTGCCPHTAIRDDVSANLLAVEALETDEGPLDAVLIESGGDNLTATFSPAPADAQVFVLDTAGGDDVPRKGGPGIERADLLVIAKADIASLVGADLGSMLVDAALRRDGRPVLAADLRSVADVAPIAAWVRERLAEHRAGALVAADPGPMAPHVHAHHH